MAKLPVLLKKELDSIQSEAIPHVAGLIARMKGECPNLPSWITDKSVEYYEGLLQGHYAMIERSLSIYKCYRGYMEMEDKVSVGSKEYDRTYNRYSF